MKQEEWKEKKAPHVTNEDFYYELVDEDGDYDGDLHIVSTIDGSQLKFHIDPIIQQARKEAREEAIEECMEIFVWLLGYSDFPERQEGEGPYWWRAELRKKLLDANLLTKLKDL